MKAVSESDNKLLNDTDSNKVDAFFLEMLKQMMLLISVSLMKLSNMFSLVAASKGLNWNSF